jgi:hypothetical protein
MKRQMRLAKASDKDFLRTRVFLHACENTMERQKFSLCSAEDYWMTWDDDDEDKQRMLKIRKRLAREFHFDEEDVDNRIIIYEFLKEVFQPASNAWHRVTMAADTLIENVCDPTVDYIEFYPGFECFHVAPEQ